MELFMYNVDEYQPLEQSNSFAPIWPFRMAISGSSDSGKTTMMINLLMGTKNVKEDGERYISCNDVVLIGKHLDKPKWKLVENFYNTLAEQGEDVSFKALSANEIPDIFEFDLAHFTIVIFEDLVNASKKIQEQIADYFTNDRHRNISSVYKGGGSLLDIKRIISQYTEHSNSLASVIDDLTLKKEFIINILSSIENRSSKFSSYGQKAILEVKKNGLLIDFARNISIPKERKILLADEIIVKNSDTWTKYIFRETFGIKSKDLGPEWIKFANQNLVH
ncbi:hypothetical protein Glove_117g585 [Diversispora epigaea]|uniref:Uncharacterized protein n=1 Tax=Diversispora epigaea TaxID=1348612 RepID=A0A397J959_9GLOM|nr:hypothetical protein Glove_117g585 [Diversispora epigaea]